MQRRDNNFLDTDDLWEVDKLELQVAEMPKNSKLDYVILIMKIQSI